MTKPRPRRWPARSGHCSTPACRRVRSPSCSAPTASPRPTSRPWRRPGSATSCAAASGSLPARRSATPSSSCGRPPGPWPSPIAAAAGPAGPRHRRVAGLHGLRPAQRRRPAGTLGIAGRAGGAGGRAGAEPRAAVRPGGLRQRTSGTLRSPSTPPPSRASRWRRCTRRKAWNGTRFSSWGSAKA